MIKHPFFFLPFKGEVQIKCESFNFFGILKRNTLKAIPEFRNHLNFLANDLVDIMNGLSGQFKLKIFDPGTFFICSSLEFIFDLQEKKVGFHVITNPDLVAVSATVVMIHIKLKS